MKRTKTMTFRISGKDRDRLRILVDKYETSAAEVLRRLVRERAESESHSQHQGMAEAR